MNLIKGAKGIKLWCPHCMAIYPMTSVYLLWPDALTKISKSHFSTQHATDGRNVEEIGDGDLRAGVDSIVARCRFFPNMWCFESYPEWPVAGKAVFVRKFWENAANSFCEIICLTTGLESEWDGAVVQPLRRGNSCESQRDNRLKQHVLGAMCGK